MPANTSNSSTNHASPANQEQAVQKAHEDMFRLTPPHSVQAEEAVLSGVFLNPEVINEILDVLSPDDFYIPANRYIFEAFLDLFNRSSEIDIVMVSDWLQNHKRLEDAGGAIRLAELSQAVVSGANAPHYAKIVRDKAVLRALINSSARIISSCYDTVTDVSVLLDNAEQSVFAISERSNTRSYHSTGELLNDVVNTIIERCDRHGTPTGLATGYGQLDAMTGGLQPSDLIIIAARPSMGKTAFALNIALRAAFYNNASIAVFSLEMSRESLLERLLCARAHVELGKVRKGTMDADDWEHLNQAAGELSDSRIMIDDSSMLSPLELRARCRRIKAEHGLDLVLVDYLQLMHSSRNDSRELEISDISRNLKALAKELNIPVIALSQLNRKNEERTDKRPQLSDLRESGAIEQDADLIMFIHRQDYYNKSKPDAVKTGIAEIIISKHRNGPTGTVQLAFVDRYTAFEELDRSAAELSQ